MKSLLDTLLERPLLFDGAMGSQLYHRGVYLNHAFDEINLSRPSLVLAVHRDYLAAGASVIETNSYGANRVRLDRHGLGDRVVEINKAAVELARRADEEGGYYVAGAVGPTGAGAIAHVGEGRRVIYDALSEQIDALVEAGIDLLCFETFVHLNEMRLALEVAAKRGGGIPVLAQMRFGPDRRLEDGTEPEEVAKQLADLGADILGANCGDGPQLVFEVARRMLAPGLPVAAQPNAGQPEEVDGRTIYVTGPEFFGVYARRLLKAGVRAVGGCCGTTPRHIRQMAGAVRMQGASPALAGAESKESVTGAALSTGLEPIPLAERSDFGRQLAEGRFVVSVEVNPPRGLNPEAQLKATRMLIDRGADVINTSDGPRASARLSNLSMARLMQEQVGCEVLLHLCCRDRNLLGMVSHLLAAHVDGIRNLVVITGDPPKLGDFPDSTAVYDLDSVALLRLIQSLNAGVDPAGKVMQEPTRFVCATGAEPAALDYERELRRVEEKKAAGADVIMTQPVYDEDTLDRFLTDVAPLGLPVMAGLLPLASVRNAEFLHHEVPGMRVPESVRERMAAAGSGAAARAEGVRLCQEMLGSFKDRLAGAYIMPPLGRYEAAAEVISVLGRTPSDSEALGKD